MTVLVRSAVLSVALVLGSQMAFAQSADGGVTSKPPMNSQTFDQAKMDAEYQKFMESQKKLIVDPEAPASTEPAPKNTKVTTEQIAKLLAPTLRMRIDFSS